MKLLECSFDSEFFYTYLTNLKNKFPQRNFIFIMQPIDGVVNDFDDFSLQDYHIKNYLKNSLYSVYIAKLKNHISKIFEIFPNSSYFLFYRSLFLNEIKSKSTNVDLLLYEKLLYELTKINLFVSNKFILLDLEAFIKNKISFTNRYYNLVQIKHINSISRVNSVNIYRRLDLLFKKFPLLKNYFKNVGFLNYLYDDRNFGNVIATNKSRLDFNYFLPIIFFETEVSDFVVQIFIRNYEISKAIGFSKRIGIFCDIDQEKLLNSRFFYLKGKKIYKGVVYGK